MTREQAIDAAVRRYMRLCEDANDVLAMKALRCGYIEGAMSAIRAHYRVICHQYGVK